MKTVLLLITSLLVATNWATADEEPDLDDPKVLAKILKEALLRDTLGERGPITNRNNYCEPEEDTPLCLPKKNRTVLTSISSTVG
jgi:hypothetical protein